MEILKDKIRKFLTISIIYGIGGGSGYGVGSSYGDGYGEGDDYSHDNCRSNGTGYGCGEGYGDGYGYDKGCGYGTGLGVKEINGHIVYIIDNTPTIITSVHNNVAKGFIVQTTLQLKPCYIVKENNQFAHGDTLRDAFMSLQEKLFDNSTEGERLKVFKKKFPEYDVKYSNRDLFTYHHILTGSCRIGRETFVVDKGLSLDGKTSVREFVELTKDSYGGEIIKKLPIVYGME